MRMHPKPELCELCYTALATDADHDHSTGKTRGWLCHPCNLGLGMFKDDPALMRAAANYIEANRAI